MQVVVILMIASRGSSIVGSGTVSHADVALPVPAKSFHRDHSDGAKYGRLRHRKFEATLFSRHGFCWRRQSRASVRDRLAPRLLPCTRVPDAQPFGFQ